MLYVKYTFSLLTKKKHPQMKLQHSKKYQYEHFGSWYIKLTLYKRFLKIK